MNRFSMAMLALTLITGCSQSNPRSERTGSAMTVAMAKQEVVDDYEVALSGKIIKNLGNGYYIFQDPTDEIRIKFAHGLESGINFTPGMRVKLSGKVDKQSSGVQINVYKVETMPADN